MRRGRLSRLAALSALALAVGAPCAGASLLCPMDVKQTDHLRAYGLTYWVLERSVRVDWLLNYRGGSFLLPDDPEIQREANIRGVSLEPISGSDEAQIMATIEGENMDKVVLEKAPRVAVYVPPTAQPWDDAVRLALEYAQIPYERVLD